jgi:hypothetical protein
MPLTKELGGISTLIKVLAAIAALFPGIAALAGVIDIPPTLKDLISMMFFSVGLITFIVILLLRRRIAAMSNGIAAVLGLTGIVFGVICAVSAYLFANSHIIRLSVEGEDEIKHVILPLNPSGDLIAVRDAYSGDWEEALHNSPMAPTIINKMEEQQASAVALLIFLMIVGETLLIAPIVAGAWKISAAEGGIGEPTQSSDAAKPDPVAANE